MSWNTTKHHYILPRSLCITILPPFSRNCGFVFCLEIPISVVIWEWERNDAIPHFGFFTILLDSVVHYFLCLRSFKASFSLFACSWWRMVMARRGLFFPFGAWPIGWRMEKHRARWSLPRCFSRIPSVVRILLVGSLVSHPKHTNYKSSNLHIIAFSASVHNPHTHLSSHQHTSSPHMHIHHPSSTFPSPSTPSPANITRPTP